MGIPAVARVKAGRPVERLLESSRRKTVAAQTGVPEDDHKWSAWGFTLKVLIELPAGFVNGLHTGYKRRGESRMIPKLFVM